MTYTWECNKKTGPFLFNHRIDFIEFVHYNLTVTSTKMTLLQNNQFLYSQFITKHVTPTKKRLSTLTLSSYDKNKNPERIKIT